MARVVASASRHENDPDVGRELDRAVLCGHVCDGAERMKTRGFIGVALGVAIAVTTPLALFLRPISSDTQMAMH